MTSKPNRSASQASQVIALLNQSLADMISLKLHAKQAHWNVKGPQFFMLHDLFDKVAAAADEYADELAERAVQLGGKAMGGIAEVGKHANAHAPAVAANSNAYVKSLSAHLQASATQTREAIDESDALDDKVTADLFTEVSAGLDKWQWMVSAQLQ